ncbi:aldehyde dehydrogenase family 16 member A1 [Neolamprologus brichardi]|uniref:aldehyde dehydrogenase family 16 member A1 n=1 Tax=Neolamprologus brichardi TaxID=32507 RepID=UPI0003EC69AC|nr:aldehyde dehydrogenase family 16 member A1 [Neolamprologus brichardi]
MAVSSTKTVYEIFQSMEYGPAATSSSATAQAWLEHHSRSLGLFIDGKFVCSADGRSCSSADSKGSIVCSTACAEEADISQCASSAVNGFKSWSSLSCNQRAKVLLRLVSVLGQHGQCLSELCELCEASCSTAALLRLLQFYSSWAQLRDTLLTDWTPLGVVAVVTSKDCPLYSLLLKVLPALAMGKTHADVYVSLLFEDGVMLRKATAGMGVPVSVSPCVGSTCPFIIFESADINSAVDEVMEAAFRKKKEVFWVLCVQESVVDSVVAHLRLRMAKMRCVTLPSEADRKRVDAAVQEAQQLGATLVQSCADPTSGAQYPPTVLCGVAPSSPCVLDPCPGPLLPLITFRSNTEAVTLGNHSPHGQAASIWTEDLTLALETAKSLSVGSVWVNSHSVCDPCLPVSGHKDSGTCTDGGQEGLYQFLRPSSSSPPLPRSSPVSMDYAQFGTETSPPLIPAESDPARAPQSHLQFVAGKACKSVSGCSVAVQPPGGSGGVLAYCPDGGRKDVRNAVEAAVKVQPGWMKKSASARAQSLYSLAKGLEAKRRDIAAAINTQTGLSVDEAEKEVELSVTRLSVWAAYCDKVQGGALPMPNSGSALSVPEALGVVGVVLPDYNPLLSMVTVLGATIATGNAVVMVPSQKYPLPVLAFIKVLQSSDLPAGLVNVITGSRDQLTVALANHSVIKAIWYWGSAEGCQYLQHTCTSPLKTLRLCGDREGKDGELDWTRCHPSFLEEMWRSAVQWKSVWIPTA